MAQMSMETSISSSAEVAQMAGDEAHAAWLEHQTQPREEG
jgi:hypothetical protein